MLKRVNAIVRKEFFQAVRDPSTLLITLFLPLLLMFLYGYGVSLDLNHLRVGLVLEDTSPELQGFAEALKGSRYFEVKVARDRREVVGSLIDGSIRGIFVVPSYFTQYRNRKDTVAPIQVIADGSETNTANFVQNYAQGLFYNWLSQESLVTGLNTEEPIIQLAPRYWYNEELESRFFLLSGSLAITMTLIGSLLTALVVAREWERGTMEAMMSTPATILELIVGKMVPYFIFGMGSMALCVTVSVLFYGLPLEGSLWALFLVSAVFLFCSLGIGLMISTLTKNQVFAYQITLIVAFLPAYILSGFLFEIHSMPGWIQWLTTIMPATYFVQSLQALFLVGNVWSLIVWDMTIIAALGAVFFLVTAAKTVKRLD